MKKARNKKKNSERKKIRHQTKTKVIVYYDVRKMCEKQKNPFVIKDTHLLLKYSIYIIILITYKKVPAMRAYPRCTNAHN